MYAYAGGNEMFRAILRTSDDLSLLLARLFLGAVFLPHGLQKLLGLFGGWGFSATVKHLVELGLPSFAAVLVIMIESFGALGLLLGFFTRVCALGIAAVMVGAIATIHYKHGFFMNWFGTKSGEGFEFHLLALGLALVLLIRGGGMLSVDRSLAD